MDPVKTSIIQIDATKPEKERVRLAADFIKQGKLVVFPTETVYGIGANAFDGEACARIFEVKNRPSDNPLVVHVDSLESAMEIGEIPKEYASALKKIWPCPITVIVKAKKKFPKQVTAGLDTVAIRVPAHPVILSLIAESGTPIAAPSANPSQKPTATTGKQTIKYFFEKVDCIIDSGETFFGVESTIIDLETFTIMRPGPFTPEEIEKAFGKRPNITEITKGEQIASTALSPGTKYLHYAPNTPLFLFKGGIGDLLDMLAETESEEIAFIGSTESCKEVSGLGFSTIQLGSIGDPYEVARNLYKGLILLDSFKVKCGIIETFAEEGIGLAIMNRIRKASAHREFKDERQLRSAIASAERTAQY